MNNKKMGLFSSMAVCVGLIVSTSCLLSLSNGFGLGGINFVIAMAVVVILNSLLALSFCELNNAMPDADGGIAQYTLVGLGPLASFVSTGASYVITNILAPALELYMCAIVIHDNLLPGIPVIIISMLMLIVVTVVNYFGIKSFATLQNIVVAVLIGSFIAFGVIANINFGVAEKIALGKTFYALNFSSVKAVLPLAFWLFVGIESVIPIAKEMKNPKRDVLLSMILGIVILFFVQTTLGIGISKYVAADLMVSSEIPHMIFAESVLGKAGVYWMSIVAVCAGISTVNTGIGNASKIMCGMAECEIIPEYFAKKNKYNSPARALFFISVGCAIVLFTGFATNAKLSLILLSASCFWLISYVLTNISLLILRKRHGGTRRFKKNTFVNAIPQIICVLSELYMIINITDKSGRIIVYSIFFTAMAALTVCGAVWIGIVKKKSLFKCPDINDIGGGKQVTRQ